MATKYQPQLRRSIQEPPTSSRGFTIVELIVVIVVLAILAAITFVSFIGLKNRAETTTVQTDLSNNSKLLKSYQALHDSYPTALDGNYCPTTPTVDNNYCLRFTNGNTMSSYTGTTSDFNLRITRDSSEPIAYEITNTTSPTKFTPSTGPPSSAPIFMGHTPEGYWIFQANNTGAPITRVYWRIFVPASCPYQFSAPVSPPVANGTVIVDMPYFLTSCTGYLGDVTWYYWFSNEYGDGPEGSHDDFWE